jgi:FkbM family methyltransferase
MRLTKKIRKIMAILMLIDRHLVARNHKLKALCLYFANHLGYYDRPKVVSWANGLRFLYKKGDASFSQNVFFGISEWEESLFLVRYLNKSDLFLDIGANNGHYSLLASGICCSQTIAVEPIPTTVEQLKQNVDLNGLNNLVTILEIGLASTAGCLFFSKNNGTMNKIVSEYADGCITVDVQTLDQLSVIPNVIKIDVEGFEYDVFRGGGRILSNPELNVIICEINFTLRVGVNSSDILNLLKSYGFDPYLYDGRELILLKSHNESTYNTIFVRNIDNVNQRLRNSKNTLKIWGDNY